MRRSVLIALLLCLLAASGEAQTSTAGTAAPLPPCTIGDVYSKTGGTYMGIYSCLGDFTWHFMGRNAAPAFNTSLFFRGDSTWVAPPSDPWIYLTVNGGSNFTTSSATAVDVTGLAFTPSANTNYEFECKISIRTPTTATVNPRVGFAWSTGLTDGVASIEEAQAANSAPLYAYGNPNAALLIAVGGLPNTTQSWPVTIRAVINAGASPSGTTRIQLASETAATNVTIQAVGSTCRYRTFP